MRLIKYFVSQLINNRSFSLLFILNLAIGLSSFVTLDVFKNSISTSINSKSKLLLGADFGLSSRQPLLDDKFNTAFDELKQPDAETSIVETFSMIAGPTGQSRLVQIKAIEEDFPFYGDITINKDNKNQVGVASRLQNAEIAWIYPELLIQLNVKIGEKIKIGQTEFVVKAIVENDSAEGITTSMAPRVYIGLKNLEKTQLIQFGSVAWYSKLYKIEYEDFDQLIDLKLDLKDKLSEPSLQIYTHKDVSEQTSRILKYLNDFLGLVSIAALFLSAIGGAFLFRSYLIKQIKPIGIYLSLGMTNKQVFLLQSLQLLMLGVISALLSLIFGFTLSPLLKVITQGLLPFELQTQLQTGTIYLILILGCVGSILIGAPILSQIYNIKPNILLRNQTTQFLKRNFGFWLSLFIGLVFLWALSVWQADSVNTGSLFTGLFILAGLLITGFAYSVLYLLKTFNLFKSLSFKWAVRDIVRLPFSSISIFLSIGLGMLLLNLIPQIKASINYELTMPKDSKLPSFFMFDIQEDQMNALKDITKKYNIDLVQTSPMVRARLKKINNKDFKDLQIDGENLNREQQRRQMSRNRGYNLSYRNGLGIGESIHKGTPLNEYDHSAMTGISLEKRFSERLDVKIGDVLLFDIQGVEVEGKIVNIRKVQWTTFQPNFFILFPDGVLNEAPKTYISSVPKISGKIKQDFQNSVVKTLPNVSIIDVTRLVKRIKGIIQQMSWALQFMTIICLLAGFLVLFSITNYQARQKSKDIALLKSLGGSFSLIRSFFNWQVLIVTVFSGLFGVLVCFILSYFLSMLLFDSKWIVELQTPILSVLGLILVSLLISYLATNKSLNIKASKLLND